MSEGERERASERVCVVDIRRSEAGINLWLRWHLCYAQ